MSEKDVGPSNEGEEELHETSSPSTTPTERSGALDDQSGKLSATADSAVKTSSAKVEERSSMREDSAPLSAASMGDARRPIAPVSAGAVKFGVDLLVKALEKNLEFERSLIRFVSERLIQLGIKLTSATSLKTVIVTTIIGPNGVIETKQATLGDWLMLLYVDMPPSDSFDKFLPFGASQQEDFLISIISRALKKQGPELEMTGVFESFIEKLIPIGPGALHRYEEQFSLVLGARDIFADASDWMPSDDTSVVALDTRNEGLRAAFAFVARKIARFRQRAVKGNDSLEGDADKRQEVQMVEASAWARYITTTRGPNKEVINISEAIVTTTRLFTENKSEDVTQAFADDLKLEGLARIMEANIKRRLGNGTPATGASNGGSKSSKPAHTASVTASTSQHGGGATNTECYFCGKMGHRQRNCPQKKTKYFQGSEMHHGAQPGPDQPTTTAQEHQQQPAQQTQSSAHRDYTGQGRQDGTPHGKSNRGGRGSGRGGRWQDQQTQQTPVPFMLYTPPSPNQGYYTAPPPWTFVPQGQGQPPPAGPSQQQQVQQQQVQQLPRQGQQQGQFGYMAHGGHNGVPYTPHHVQQGGQGGQYGTQQGQTGGPPAWQAGGQAAEQARGPHTPAGSPPPRSA
jgi:hypothetical protein